METLKTATGKEFMCDYFNPFPQAAQVNIRVLNVTISDVAAVFANPKETVQLWCGGTYLANHTKLLALIPEDNAIRVVLGKE